MARRDESGWVQVTSVGRVRLRGGMGKDGRFRPDRYMEAVRSQTIFRPSASQTRAAEKENRAWIATELRRIFERGGVKREDLVKRLSEVVGTEVRAVDQRYKLFQKVEIRKDGEASAARRAAEDLIDYYENLMDAGEEGS